MAIPERIEAPTLADYLGVMSRAVFQAGLSWRLIESKWDSFLRSFDRFDPVLVAAYDETDVERIVTDGGIVATRKKVAATIQNARALLALECDCGMRTYLRSFASYAALVADLRGRFKFLGELSVYYFLFRVGEPVPRFEEWERSIPGDHPRVREMMAHARSQGCAAELDGYYVTNTSVDARHDMTNSERQTARMQRGSTHANAAARTASGGANEPFEAKTATKKSTAKSTATKGTARKGAAKKGTAKKSTTQKSTAKSTAKKGTAKKGTAKKSAAKKTVGKAAATSATSKKRSAATSEPKYGPQASAGVRSALGEMKRGTLRSGTSGRKVTNRKQAIAIGLSEARRDGAKVPPEPKSGDGESRGH